MRAIQQAIVAIATATLWAATCGATTPETPKLLKSTADHGKFKQLQKPFASGPEVTRACLECHTEASKQIHLTQHWKWEYRNPQSGQLLGKKHLVNNFCTSVASNYKACASCHIGYNTDRQNFDLGSESNVDCLVCHDRTGKYKKPGGFAGNPVTRDTEFPPGSGKIIRGIDLSEIAQKVGAPTRSNCGLCHFYGGGGDGVKHGDLDSSLEAPDKSLDVHMDADGLNFTCATCHRTEGHQVPGSRYAPTAQDKGDPQQRGKAEARNPATCPSCHGQTPHKTQAKLNDHTDKLACQACHIPAFARGEVPTKMSWDWSTAGKRDATGKPMVIKNEAGYDTYLGIKGDFVFAENVQPEYVWFNGKVKYTLADDKIDKARQPIYINQFEGSAEDGKSMIWPVKIFRGKQPFDAENRTLTINHLAGQDDAAYWTNLNWDKAIAAGMAAAGKPFSGKYDFIETIGMWPITHMVAPKDKAVACGECHASNGRLEKIDGIYIPGRGRDHLPLLDTLGWALAGLTLLGVIGHGIGRLATARQRH